MAKGLKELRSYLKGKEILKTNKEWMNTKEIAAELYEKLI